MPKPKTEDRNAVADKNLTIRISPRTRGLLDALVAAADEEVSKKGGRVTMGSYVTSLIENAAKAAGIAALPSESAGTVANKKK